jgi:hypothetical protein
MGGGVDVQIHVFLTLALVGGERSASRPGDRAHSTHWIGGWVGPRNQSGRRGEDKILDPTKLKLQPLGHPASSLSLYQLRYPISSRITTLRSSTIYWIYD